MERIVHMVDRRTPPGLAMQLSLLRRKGDNVVAVGAPPAGLEAIDVRLNPARTLMGGWASLLGGATDGASAVHAWSTGPASLAGSVLADRLGVPFGLSVASADGLRRESCYAPAAIASANAITVPTRWDADTLARRGRDPSKLTVLPPSARPLVDRDALRRETRARLALRPDDRLLVCPLPLTRDAGHRLAAWIRGVLWMAGHRLDMLLPTAGDDRQQAEYFVRTSSPGGRIILPDEYRRLLDAPPPARPNQSAQTSPDTASLGPDANPGRTNPPPRHPGRPDEDPARPGQAACNPARACGRYPRLQAALAAADVAILCPARSMGGTWLTACLACGVPVVANPLPAHAELAGHDQAALLTVEPAAPRRGAAGVLRVLEDEALRERLVAGGLGRAAVQHVPTSARSALGSAWDSAPGVTG